MENLISFLIWLAIIGMMTVAVIQLLVKQENMNKQEQNWDKIRLNIIMENDVGLKKEIDLLISTERQRVIEEVMEIVKNITPSNFKTPLKLRQYLLNKLKGINE